jgi:Fe-S cluster assembly protein SufD
MTAEFVTQHLALAQHRSPLSWLSALNQRGQARFADAVIPTRKTEAWKYTSLASLAQGDFAHAAPSVDASTITLPNITGVNALRLVVINGELNTEVSDAKALELIVRFADATQEQQDQINALLGSAQGEVGHLFTQLNDAAINDGLFLNIPRNQRLEQPIHICYLTTPNSEENGFTVNTRLLVNLETSAEATVIEHYIGDEEQNSFTNAVSEFRVGDNAKLIHYRLQLMTEGALHIGSAHIDLQRDANYEGFHLGLGTKLTRNDIVVNHNVGGSHSEMAGVYVPKNKQLIDFHTCIEHKAAHCTSNEVFRGIMNDQSKAVFNGRIQIHRDAQKTLAELSNKNLLLTNTAEINTKPELEIYADDVKCAHGATVAQLEEKAMFYLQSRGISKAEAKVMLSFGFINELIDNLPHEAIGDWLRPILAHRFGRDSDLDAQLAQGN